MYVSVGICYRDCLAAAKTGLASLKSIQQVVRKEDHKQAKAVWVL